MGKRRFQVPLLFSLVLFGIGIASARFFSITNVFSPISSILAESPFSVTEYVVQPGDAWGVMAPQLGITSNLAALLLTASEAEGAHPLTDIRAGNKLSIYTDRETGEFDHLLYDINDEEILSIATGTSGLTALKEDIPYAITPVIKRGVIENSLFESASLSGVPEEVILDMAWIFSWDIDFNTAIREGDSFTVLYEERTRDGVPVKPGRVLGAEFKNDGREYLAFYYKNPERNGAYYDANGNELKRQFRKSPMDIALRVTSGFTAGKRIIQDYIGSHRAIDYAASVGTPVVATADGTVDFMGWNGQHGMHVRLKHGNGYTTGYSHLSAYAKGMKIGARVKQGQVIAFSGETGFVTGPHLHYEMKLNGQYVNPMTLESPPGEALKDEYRADFEARKAELQAVLGI